MASPELSLVLLSIGLVLTSRRAMRGYSRHHVPVQNGPDEVRSPELSRDGSDKHRRGGHSDDYRPMVTFSNYYDVL